MSSRTVFGLLGSLLISATVAAQTAPITGEAILRHPVGVLGTRSVEVIAAGKFDDYSAMRTKDDQAEWKATSAAEKKSFGDRLKENAPTPAAFADLVRKAGELTINGDMAVLAATTPAGTLRQVFALEGGQWRLSFGPYFMAERAPGSRVEGADLARHPAVAVVLQYNDLVQAGNTDGALARFGTTKAQTEWKALPASEKRESAAFRKRLLPARAALASAIASGGLLLVEGDEATLNVMAIQAATATNPTATSSTIAIPLALENGAWKIAQ
jgi:hypothetical protein